MSETPRPLTFDEFIGQPKLKQTLNIKIASSIARGEPMEDILFDGPPGSGKTSLAGVIANELAVPFMSFIMPLKPGMLQKLVTSFEGVVLFDEIHRCSNKEQEEMLPLIEDGYVQLKSGQRAFRSNLTILAATTERDQIITPLYDRFFSPPFEEYTNDELAQIAMGMAEKAGLELPYEVAEVLGGASAGVPRHAEHLVKMYRDLWYAYSEYPSANEVLSAARVTPDGLTEDHVEYLKILKKLGGVSGLDIMASQLHLSKSSTKVLEDFLIKKNFIIPTKQGRELQSKGYQATGENFDFI